MAGVRYRGFDERTELVRWGLPAIALGIIMGGTLPTAIEGVIAAWQFNPASLPWLFERLFAWMAYLAMAGSVVYGLLLSTKLLDALAHRPVSFALHQDLAAVGVGLAGIHGMLLGLDHTMPFSLAQILVPGLAPHAPLFVAFGQVSLYLALIVVGSFYVRRVIGHRTWRTLHYLTFVVFVGATAHGLGAGTDSGASWAQWIYLGAGTAVWFLLVYRIGISLAERVAGGREPQPARRGPQRARPLPELTDRAFQPAGRAVQPAGRGPRPAGRPDLAASRPTASAGLEPGLTAGSEPGGDLELSRLVEERMRRPGHPPRGTVARAAPGSPEATRSPSFRPRAFPPSAPERVSVRADDELFIRRSRRGVDGAT